ncbi:MAG: AAA family ATPase [Chloroflexi bacterium]|nr:AAA family ATPase [Chloroflexota bacterium]
MRIRHLRLRDFQRHERLDLKLADGLNVIRGPNEAGKTTIQRALELALYRRCTAAGREMDGYRSWGVGSDRPPQVELDFEDDGVSGRLTKRFAGSRGTVAFTLGNEKASDPAFVDRRIAELTGIPSEKFFRSTASVRHEELDELGSDEGTLRDRLQSAISGADRGTSTAKRRLDDALRRYTAEGPKNPGHLKRAREEAAWIEAELRAGEAELERLERDQAALFGARERQAAAEVRLSDDRRLLTESERAVELKMEVDAAQARYERLKRATEIRLEIGEREASHPSKIPLAQLRADVERLRQLEAAISGLRAELATETEVASYDVGIQVPNWSRWAILAIVLAVVAVILALARTALGLGIAGALLALVVGAGAVGSTFWAVRERNAAFDERRQTLLRDEQIARRLRGRSELAHELAENERQRTALLERLGIEDVPTAERLLTAEAEHVAGIDELRAELRGVAADVPEDANVAVLRDEAAAEADQRRHALAGMGEIGASPLASRDRYRAAVAASQRELEGAIAQEAGACALVEQNSVDAERVASLAEQHSAALDRLASAERRLRVYETTLKTLIAAEEATMKRAARYLETHMSRDVSLITGGRYRRVRVDEQQLTFRVWAPERGHWVEVQELSQGTLDQFYLAARLGLVRQVTQGGRPPLILDDPFVSFDDERAVRSAELLKAMAADYQVLLLTTSDRYDSVADTVIKLAGPTGTDSGNGLDSERPAQDQRSSASVQRARRPDRASTTESR